MVAQIIQIVLVIGRNSLLALDIISLYLMHEERTLEMGDIVGKRLVVGFLFRDLKKLTMLAMEIMLEALLTRYTKRSSRSFTSFTLYLATMSRSITVSLIEET